MRQPQSSILGH
jgi:hypothetical protein